MPCPHFLSMYVFGVRMRTLLLQLCLSASGALRLGSLHLNSASLRVRQPTMKVFSRDLQALEARLELEAGLPP